jgi:hypothetical protein
MTFYLWDTKKLLKKRVINSGRCQGTWLTSFFKIFQKDSLEICSPNLTRSNPLRPRYHSSMWCLCTFSFTKTLKWELMTCSASPVS